MNDAVCYYMAEKFKEITVEELFALYVETNEKIKNRPDAIIVREGKVKNRSHYQTKMLKIKRIALRLEAHNKTERVFLDKILGRE